MKWILTKELQPPKGKNLVVGWYNKPTSVRSFEGATINYHPMDWWSKPPDFWALIETLEMPSKPKEKR